VTDWISSHRFVAAAVSALLVVGLALAVTTRGSGAGDAGTASTTTVAGPAGAEGGASSGGSTTSTTAPAGQDPNEALATGLPSTPTDLPVEVTVTSGAVDAAGLFTASVHIVADAGSQIYGAEARICPSDVVVVHDADFRPTQTGLCVLHPLRAGADDHLEVAGAMPYQELDLSFRTGSGSDTYQTQAGDDVTIRCDADHPCSLTLKLQVPNAFGFQSYPIPFS
jgi:hypothetical protein